MRRSFALLGILYIVLSFLSFFHAVYYYQPEAIFWFCYAGLGIIGLGLLFNNATLVKSQLCILFIPDLIWTLDFVMYLVTGASLLGTADYVFLPGLIWPKLVTLQHIITIPVALFLFPRMKQEKHAWLIGWVQMILVFVITRIVTSYESNVNCAYRLCGQYTVPWTSIEYLMLWMIVTLVMVYVAYRILSLLPTKVHVKRSK